MFFHAPAREARGGLWRRPGGNTLAPICWPGRNTSIGWKRMHNHMKPVMLYTQLLLFLTAQLQTALLGFG